MFQSIDIHLDMGGLGQSTGNQFVDRHSNGRLGEWGAIGTTIAECVTGTARAASTQMQSVELLTLADSQAKCLNVHRVEFHIPYKQSVVLGFWLKGLHLHATMLGRQNGISTNIGTNVVEHVASLH